MKPYTCPKCQDILVVEKSEIMGVETQGVKKITVSCPNRRECGIYKAILFDNSEGKKP